MWKVRNRNSPSLYCACVHSREPKDSELLKTRVVTEEYNETFDVALGCLRDLEIVSRDIQLALALLPNFF